MVHALSHSNGSVEVCKELFSFRVRYTEVVLARRGKLRRSARKRERHNARYVHKPKVEPVLIQLNDTCGVFRGVLE